MKDDINAIGTDTLSWMSVGMIQWEWSRIWIETIRAKTFVLCPCSEERRVLLTPLGARAVAPRYLQQGPPVPVDPLEARDVAVVGPPPQPAPQQQWPRPGPRPGGSRSLRRCFGAACARISHRHFYFGSAFDVARRLRSLHLYNASFTLRYPN